MLSDSTIPKIKDSVNLNIYFLRKMVIWVAYEQKSESDWLPARQGMTARPCEQPRNRPRHSILLGRISEITCRNCEVSPMNVEVQNDGQADGQGADVIVIGGGPAGLMAAIEASDLGAEVVLLESENQLGGGMLPATGHVTLCETKFAPEPRALLLQDLAHAHPDADPALLQVYVDRSGRSFARLEELGVRFAKSVQLAHMSAPWAHEMPLQNRGGGAQIVDALVAAAQSRPIRILRRVRARRLVRDQQRVTHVEVETEGRCRRFEARRAVVLATGGFSRNPDLIKHFGGPGTQRIMPVTAPGSRGDGLLMAMALGAGTRFLTAGIAASGPVDRHTGVTSIINYCGAILLNKAGRRFCDESEPYTDITLKGLSQPESLMIQIFDAKVKDNFSKTMWSKVYAGAREFTADTLEDLVTRLRQECGLDPEKALETIHGYNAAIGSGQDAFGRKCLVGSVGAPQPITAAPFHAIIAVPGTTHFNGGLALDARMRVLDVFNEPVPGLFSAGEVTGGFHGTGYMSGSHIGMALVFGREAGINAAAHSVGQG
ncbi:FAD-dependent oxidoreductase [Paracoccus sp. pheM1]|uniref:FAD-dependent oxidoreductase n=1 Tax=Paracoccus sp. pheM1 TaxID=2831675 RepID=UPI001BDB8C2B|nr:FAD-dependent oxidoreductase [Paracoccus sp. pheM1]MBT0779088.1 FAD-dependent oxidoreductase [Paracoccus sp. pheM1]